MMQREDQLLKIYSSPQLKEPFLVAAGLGTANVGLRTVGYLRDKLGAELFAEIELGDFFTPPHSFAFRDGLIEIAPVELIPIPYRARFQNWPGMYWRLPRALDFTGYICRVPSSPISIT
jgi:hypothetical protein